MSASQAGTGAFGTPSEGSACHRTNCHGFLRGQALTDLLVDRHRIRVLLVTARALDTEVELVLLRLRLERGDVVKRSLEAEGELLLRGGRRRMRRAGLCCQPRIDESESAAAS
jgi:hypothetical protein